VADPEDRGGQTREQGPHAFLSPDLEDRVEDPSVHPLVVLLVGTAEGLRLHSRTDYPEGICYNVTKEATETG